MQILKKKVNNVRNISETSNGGFFIATVGYGRYKWLFGINSKA